MIAGDSNSNGVANNKACPRWCFQIGKLSLMPRHGLDEQQKEISTASNAHQKRLRPSIEWHPEHYAAIRKDSGEAAEVSIFFIVHLTFIFTS